MGIKEQSKARGDRGPKENLNPDIIASNMTDAWLQSFAAAKDYMDLTAYENTIQFNMGNIISEGGHTDSTNPKIFPIVFHAIVDTPDLLSPGSGDIMTFSVEKIIGDINKSFASTGIKFLAAEGNLAENTPDAISGYYIRPGLNIISAKDLEGERGSISPTFKSRTHKYRKSGIAITDWMWPRGIRPHPQEGVLMKDLQKYEWDPTKVINVFLINDFSWAFKDLANRPVMSSTNPYIYDARSAKDASPYFNIVLPFWALGQPYQDEVTPGYGYRYEDPLDEDSINYSQVEYPIFQRIGRELHFAGQEQSSSVVPYYGKAYSGTGNRALPLVKSLGHLLGLASVSNIDYKSYPATMFDIAGWTPIEAHSGACEAMEVSSCIYQDHIPYEGFESLVCGDCVDDTDDMSIFSIAPDSGSFFGDRGICPGSSGEFKNSLYNYMSDTALLGESLYYEYNTFTPQQALRMHANIDLNYSDSETGDITQGVLKKILTSNTPTYDYEVTLIEMCDDEQFRTTQIASEALLTQIRAKSLLQVNMVELFNSTVESINALGGDNS